MRHDKPVDPPIPPRPAVLIIGTGTMWRRHLEDRLHRAGCDVMTAANASQGVEQAVAVAPDVVMLGHDLPDVDSLEVCRRIRNRLRPQRPPVFLVTPEDRKQASDPDPRGPDSCAGDDRPWWRIHSELDALLAGREGPSARDANSVVQIQGLELDHRRHSAMVNGRDLNLTPTEFRLLSALAQTPGQVYDRAQLTQLCRIRGRRGHERTIDVHVKSIRAKLDRHAGMIETVHGVGYRFRDDRSETN